MEADGEKKVARNQVPLLPRRVAAFVTGASSSSVPLQRSPSTYPGHSSANILTPYSCAIAIIIMLVRIRDDNDDDDGGCGGDGGGGGDGDDGGEQGRGQGRQKGARVGRSRISVA